MLRTGVRLALFFLIATVAWWPLDLWIFADRPDLIQRWADMRGGVIAANMLVLIAHAAGRIPRAGIGALYTIVVCIQFFWASRVLGADSGFGSPVVTYFYLAPFLSLALMWPVSWRALAAGAIVLSVWLGFYAAEPNAIAASTAWRAQTTFLIFCAALACGIGHLWYRVIRSDFLARRRLATRDRELQDMAEHLQQRVDQQTIELRRLAAHIDDTRDAERRWIAAELHDELGQQLAAMRLASDYGRGVSAPGPGRDVFVEIGSLLDRTHETIRRILRAMQPKILDELGLPAALCWLGDELTERSNLVCSVSTPVHAVSMSPQVAAALFRCAQEACTNCVRHADASEIHIELIREHHHWVLTVRDDGRGIAPRLSAGLGMTGIRERSLRWGGRAEWTSSEGGGTTVRIELPTHDHEPDSEVRP